MHETSDDLNHLQQVLDASYASAGRHLLEVISPERRLDAAAVSDQLQDMCLLVLATVTADGRPITGPVDGIFYRGAFHFGSAPDSMRFRHIRRRAAVSASHLPGEHLAVSVHGTAEPIDVNAPDHTHFRQTLLDIYVPRYGDSWVDMLDGGAIYARIEAHKMFTFSMPEAAPSTLG